MTGFPLYIGILLILALSIVLNILSRISAGRPWRTRDEMERLGPILFAERNVSGRLRTGREWRDFWELRPGWYTHTLNVYVTSDMLRIMPVWLLRYLEYDSFIDLEIPIGRIVGVEMLRSPWMGRKSVLVRYEDEQGNRHQVEIIPDHPEKFIRSLSGR